MLKTGRSRRHWLAALAKAGVTAGVALRVGSGHARSALEDDEGVLVFPSVARRLDDTRVWLRVEAWVYEHERIRMRTAALARWLGLDLDELDPADRELFLARAQLFGNEAQARRVLRVRGAQTPWTRLPASGADGRIDTTLIVPQHVVDGGRIALQIEAKGRRFDGHAQVIDAQGLSVVSDIDDTIKHTQVRVRREMLRNTFARPFTAVPGMADWYARIGAANAGAAFHYVSSGPYQLFPVLHEFVANSRFPHGSLHLRALSLRPAALLSKDASKRHKTSMIGRLLGDFPKRRFVLIGDSGEADPEIYGAITRMHPERIAAVLIRDVTAEAADSQRYAMAFEGIDRERWQIFTEPEALPTVWG